MIYPNSVSLLIPTGIHRPFLDRYNEQFNSNYIAELLCRMAFLEPNATDLARLELPWEEPPFEVPSLLIHTTTTRAAKIWPFQAWDTVLHGAAAGP